MATAAQWLETEVRWDALRRVAGDHTRGGFVVTKEARGDVWKRGDVASGGEAAGGARGHVSEEQQKEQRGRWKQL